ncbi:MAG: NADH-quinone oxidoreductase subunit N, partial [Deltaproteobacteria bacterium]|nr:NADH-quinone oxidoreductase subunit N [Deltaproteobacteria bacterium]
MVTTLPTDWPGLIPLFILAGGGTFIFCAGAFWRRLPDGVLFALALISAAAAGAAALWITPGNPTSEGMLDLGGYARFFTCLFMLITVLTCLFLRQYARLRGFAGDELYGLLLFAALGMVLIAGALNWVIFFLGFQTLSLALYVLVAVRKGEAASNEAGIKYFIMSAVASAVLAFGIALLYAVSGTLQIAGSLTALVRPEDLAVSLLALALILVGVGFKTSLVPFHLWTPDVYQGAPAPITAFLAAGSKVALFAALLRFSIQVAAPVWAYCLPALWVLAALTMAVGNITALYQTSFKRLLAYSSIGQMGYLFMTLLAVNQGGLPALMFYLAVYAVMDLGAFGLIGSFSPPSARPDLDELADYQGLGYSQPYRSGVLALCLISLAGLPPTAGFMGKFALFRATLHAGYVILAIIGILTANP